MQSTSPNYKLARLPDKSEVYKHIQNYARPSELQSWWELLSTIICFYLCWMTNWKWAIALITAAFRVRLFVIFHDMGHGSFFSSSRLNYIMGLFVAPLVWTPVSFWVKGHNYHHKVSNNLDKKQYAQTSPWTVKEFQAQGLTGKIIYTFIYGPYSLWTVIPSLYFMAVQRIFSKWYENLLQIIYLSFIFYLGTDYLKYDLIVTGLASCAGLFLFHVQHTFPYAYRKRSNEWDYYENGMRGSSYLQLPWYLAYFTFGIEYHHIHHLNTRVPGYKLKKCHDEGRHLFRFVPHLSLKDAFQTITFSLYNEEDENFTNVYSELL